MAVNWSSADGGERDWACGLPSPALVLIAELLSAPDLACLRSVCNPWWSRLRHLIPPSPEFPWLMVPTRGGGGIKSDTRTFLSLPDRRQYRFSSPHLVGKKVISCGHGWLALVDDQCGMSLFQPITKALIPLPPVITAPGNDFKVVRNKSTGRIRKFVDRHTLCSFTPAIFRFMFFYKVLLSCSPTASAAASDCVVVLQHYYHYKLAVSYARLGDTTWTVLQEHDYVLFEDIIFLNSHRLLALTPSYLVELDFGTCPSPRITSTAIESFDCWDTYLVACGGDLLAVLQRRGVVPDPRKGRTGRTFVTDSVQVKRLDSKCEGGGPQWIETKDLKGHALFVGPNNSISCAEPNDYGLKANCIYFTDGYKENAIYEEWKKATRDVVVFDLEKQSCEFCYPPDDYLTYPSPIWFIPSFH